METNDNYQIMCKIPPEIDDLYEYGYYEEKIYEKIVDISNFKNGSFCLLYSDKLEYYSKIYRFLYDIPLDYNPTHLLTLIIKSKLYAIVRNRKSLYLYLLEDAFIYKTNIDLNDDITYWTKTKDNQILICSKNKILFYEIKNNNFLKTQNEIIINEETFIENSPYFKKNKEIKEKKAYSKNLLILKIFELENDYIIVIKKDLYEIEDVKETCDCPQCCIYICDQTSFKLLSIIKLNKKEQKIKNIYEIEFQIKFKNEYNYVEYYHMEEVKDQLYYFDISIIDSIEILENKVLFYIPELKNIEIIDINSSFDQKYKSALYNPGTNLESYKIIFLSENCFYIFKCKYERYSEFVDKNLVLINNNKERDSIYYAVFIKKINSLLFVFEDNTLIILRKLI